MSTKEMNTNFEQLLEEIRDTEEFDIEVVRDVISEQIFRIMEAEEISKAELARRLETSPPYVTKLLQGNGNFTIETLVKIARALGYRFRPMFFPTSNSWKQVAEYTKTTNFKATEKRSAITDSFKPTTEVHIDSDDCNGNIEIVNNERLEPITN